jgi:hypothetical protein
MDERAADERAEPEALRDRGDAAEEGALRESGEGGEGGS